MYIIRNKDIQNMTFFKRANEITVSSTYVKQNRKHSEIFFTAFKLYQDC